MKTGRRTIGRGLLAAWMAFGFAGAARSGETEGGNKDTPACHPAAILAFAERGAGAKGQGEKTSDLLFAALAENPALFLVDRQELDKVLDEQALNLSGAVSPGNAVQIGQLTGARILITGSVIEAGPSLYLVARIIGTETTRVLGASVKGRTDEELAPLVEKLAAKVAETITAQAHVLVAKEIKMEDRLAALKMKLGEAARPVVAIQVDERHVGWAGIDPAAETELILFCRAAGFDVRDRTADRREVDVVLEGEGFSELAMRRGNLVSVKARLEVKAVDRKSGRVLAVDRQTSVAVDLTEQIAGKAALQDAAAAIAERLLPKLAQ
jgi:TolB-like protein